MLSLLCLDPRLPPSPTSWCLQHTHTQNPIYRLRILKTQQFFVNIYIYCPTTLESFNKVTAVHIMQHIMDECVLFIYLNRAAWHSHTCTGLSYLHGHSLLLAADCVLSRILRNLLLSASRVLPADGRSDLRLLYCATFTCITTHTQHTHITSHNIEEIRLFRNTQSTNLPYRKCDATKSSVSTAINIIRKSLIVCT